MQLNLILINMRYGTRELGDISNKIQQCRWLRGEVQVLSSDETDIVGWKVSDSLFAVANCLIQLSPAEPCKLKV